MEGAFPNAVSDKLIHNLWKCKIPKAYIDFVHRLLDRWKTTLKFNDFISELVDICNRIGQGNPLSIILFLYNADLIKMLVLLDDEDLIGYVDNAMAIAVSNNFYETTQMLAHMMTRDDGGFAWSFAHNSCFKISKPTPQSMLTTGSCQS